MLNPDAIPDPDWLANLKKATQRYPGVVAFGSTQLDAVNPGVLDGAGDNYSIYGLAWRGGHGGPPEQITGDIRVFSACGAASLYRRDVFEAVGGFAESFFCYLEDVDLGFRLNLLGYEVIQVVDARVAHFGGASSGGKASRFAMYHGLRNSVFVSVRCLPLLLLLVALPLLIFSQVWIGLRAGPFGLRVKSVFAGLTYLPSLLGERRLIQNTRRLTVAQVATLLVWSPRLVNRLAVVALPRLDS
jgi:GT2 family glycosyltransferase